MLFVGCLKKSHLIRLILPVYSSPAQCLCSKTPTSFTKSCTNNKQRGSALGGFTAFPKSCRVLGVWATELVLKIIVIFFTLTYFKCALCYFGLFVCISAGLKTKTKKKHLKYDIVNISSHMRYVRNIEALSNIRQLTRHIQT